MLRALFGAYVVVALFCSLVFVSAQAQEAPPLDPRCAYVDLDDWLGAQPYMRCFDLEMKCSAGETLGCFKRSLLFEDGFIREPGRPEMRRTAAQFGFIDAGGKHWDVPAGYLTDGASIPAAFKPFIGGSWTEGYIRAAVLHDFYIRRRTSNASAVHRLFFDALLASGVAYDRAILMYAAVRNFGPDWKSIDLEAFERERQAELAKIRAQNAIYEAEYRSCLEQRLQSLQVGATEEAWNLCPLDGKHQFILDLIGTAADVVREAAPSMLEDFQAGRCIEEAPGKYYCP